MTIVASEVTDALRSMLAARTAWDEAPDLHFLYQECGRVRPSAEGKVFPPEMWPEVPTLALPVMADLVEEWRAVIVPAVPGKLIGVAFRCETWMVEVKKGQPDADHLRKMHRARKLEYAPGRVESRNAWAALTDGGSAWARQIRGESAIEIVADNPGEGLIPDSLRRMAAVLAGGPS